MREPPVTSALATQTRSQDVAPRSTAVSSVRSRRKRAGWRQRKPSVARSTTRSGMTRVYVVGVWPKRWVAGPPARGVRRLGAASSRGRGWRPGPEFWTVRRQATGGQPRTPSGGPGTPPLTHRLRAHPQPRGDLARRQLLLEHPGGLQPHPLPRGSSSSRQATTIGIPHDTGVDPGRVKIT